MHAIGLPAERSPFFFPVPRNWKKILLPIIFVAMLASMGFAGSAQAAPFVDNGNGTVLDRGTGLMWQKGDSYHDLGKGVNWYQALEYIAKKNSEKFAGYEDWRLPTLDELNALWIPPNGDVQSKDEEPLGLPDEFKGGGSYYIWSSKERGLDHAWYFGLGRRENYFNLKDLADLDQGVKMVRDAGPEKKAAKE